jgi:hypothetical protein
MHVSHCPKLPRLQLHIGSLRLWPLKIKSHQLAGLTVSRPLSKGFVELTIAVPKLLLSLLLFLLVLLFVRAKYFGLHKRVSCDMFDLVDGFDTARDFRIRHGNGP